ncbi:sugar-transfer associated ATP-grasp domain-containing protein [Haliea sp.]
MGGLGKLDDYVEAVSVARNVHNLSALAAIRSVAKARLVFRLGPRMHAMLGMAGVPQSEWKHFQQEKDLEVVLQQLNPAAKRSVADNKILFSRHCEAYGLAHIQTIFHDPLEHSLSDDELREDFCRCIGSAPDALFFKLMGGAHGYGAFSAERSNTIWSYCGETGTTGDLYEFCRKRQGASRGWLVQPVVNTHSRLQEVSSCRALSTARLLTCMTPEGPALLTAVLKLARGLNETDNFDMGRGGNMVAQIDIASGRLGPAKGSLSKDFPCIISFAVDPDTGHHVAGRLVPFWEETKALVLRAQSTLPELKSLGWDVAITDEGPFVVETNSNYGSDSTQVAYGRGLRPILLSRLKKLAETSPDWDPTDNSRHGT